MNALVDAQHAAVGVADLDSIVRVRESHRIMRAYFGQHMLSYLAFSLLLSMIAFLLMPNGGAQGMQIAEKFPQQLALGLAGFAAVMTLALLILSWFQYLHRRVAMLWPALAALASMLANVFFCVRAGEAFGAAGGGALQLFATFILVAAAITIGLGLSANAFRLVVAARPSFATARGWTPPRYTPMAAIRRMLGAPTYVSSLAHSRAEVTALFLLSGVLCAGAALVPFVGVAWVLQAVNSAIRLLSGGGGGLQFIVFVLAYIAAPFLLLHVLAFLGRQVMRAGQALAAKKYQSIRDWDERAPILYLRSFAIDKQTVKIAPRGIIARLIGLGARYATLDETVLDCAAPYGPVVAIGDPRDPIPPLGAARTFVNGDDWQSVVSGLAKAAPLIVLAADVSEGVRWEVNHILSDPALRGKTLFVASPTRSAEENRRALSEIARTLGHTAPLAANAIALSATADGVETMTAPTRSSDAYACALNRRLQRDLGLDVDFPERNRGFGAYWLLPVAMCVGLGVIGALTAFPVYFGLAPDPAEQVVIGPPEKFDDCAGASWCPRMVVIPAGGFDDNDVWGSHGRVNIRRFAAGKFVVTREQWTAFATETAWVQGEAEFLHPCDWQGAEMPMTGPVGCITWDDALSYVQWLSQRTGHRYRLLTDAEWDYVARSGAPDLRSGYSVITPNRYGISDIDGPTWQWTQDCAPSTGVPFPHDGSAVPDEFCSDFIIRGGYYTTNVSTWNGYRRGHMDRSKHFSDVGLRVARDLD